MSGRQPAMVLEDLGLKLDEDSEDLLDSEVAEAIGTTTPEDFVAQAAAFFRTFLGGHPRFELRRRAGILYCRASVGGNATRVFHLPWLRVP